MKVTVTQNLNARVGAPSLNAPCFQFLTPGTELEVDGRLYPGDAFEGQDNWLKDASGNYYWVGGVDLQAAAAQDAGGDFQQFLDDSLSGTSLNRVINYGQLLNIDQGFKRAGGRGVTIAVVDHPMSASLQSNVTIQRPIASGNPRRNFHANFIFGIIAGINNIIGISSQVKVISLPIFDEIGDGLTNGIENALKFIAGNPDPMIVNISAGFEDNFDAMFRNFSSNKIIVAAGGMNDELSNDKLIYPASLPAAIAVGAVEPATTSLRLNPKVDCMLPNFNFVSFKDSGGYFADKGDSFATAVISSVIALLISSGAVGYDRDAIISQLNSMSMPLSSNNTHASFNLLKP